jgi:hypothetical protein
MHRNNYGYSNTYTSSFFHHVFDLFPWQNDVFFVILDDERPNNSLTFDITQIVLF